MLNADVYAELIDRHVELASDISWLLGLLDNADAPGTTIGIGARPVALPRR
jgi:hypothetical protein